MGLLNTLLVAGIGIVLATVLGLSSELRGFPPTGWLHGLPAAMSSSSATCRSCSRSCSGISPCSARCRDRGKASRWLELLSSTTAAFCARADGGKGSGLRSRRIDLGVVATTALIYWAKRRQARTGRRSRCCGGRFSLIVIAASCCMMVTGFPLGIAWPQLRGFNFVGGIRLTPEFVALAVALTIYTGGIHCRDRPRRHPCGATRPVGGGVGARAAPRVDAFGSSSSRRRCA